MKKAKLVILRHGQTDQNTKGLITGQMDVPLNAVGEEQAREAGKLISVIHFDKVYSSTLSRAFNTAALALKAAGQDIPIEKRKEIMEKNAGDFTGRSHKTDPEFLAWNQEYDTRMPNGESDADVVARVQKLFDEEILPRLMRGENVLIVGHSGILRAFDIVLGIEKVESGNLWTGKKQIHNAAPTVYEYAGGILKKSYPLESPKQAPPAANQNLRAPAQKKPGGLK